MKFTGTGETLQCIVLFCYNNNPQFFMTEFTSIYRALYNFSAIGNSEWQTE